jgi:hypothetical protein
MEKSWISLYKTSQWQVKVLIQNESVWMTQAQIWELFWKDRSVISKHISNIYLDWELEENKTTLLYEANVQNMHISTNKPTKYYNLALIFAVWYRIRNSEKAIAFRNWATSILKEFSLRGFVMDDERLENWNTMNWKIDFDNLLHRVREIRFSEKQIYEKIKDLFTTSTDYDSKSDITKTFFAKIQNKFVYAITWHTTAELIVNRISSDKQALWMQNIKKSTITKKEAHTWKNYLLEKELKQLYLLCEQFFSFAELQLSLEREMKMKDWSEFLDDILKMNKLEVLENAWKISKEKMEEIVEREIKKYQEKWWSLDIYIETIQELKKLSN